MVTAAYQYPLIRQYSTGNGYAVQTVSGRTLEFRNTNALIPQSGVEHRVVQDRLYT
jgi:D-alanyl-D-alanine endopeptidase (penicillin-binding protein 7)